MGKLKDLAAINSANKKAFAYMPPHAAYGALRTLIKIDVASVSLEMLGAVLRGLRRVNPHGRIVIVDRFESREAFDATGIIDLMDDEMRATTIENLVMQNFRNVSPVPARYLTVTAPTYFAEYECVLSVCGISERGAALANLSNIFVEGRIKTDAESEKIDVSTITELADVYFSVGHLLHGAVVEYGGENGKVIWGDDLLAVDEHIYRLTGEPVPDVMSMIRQFKKQISD